jgi:diacylglycerol kinase family enzyme
MRFLIVHNAKAGFGSDAIFAFERALLKGGDECVMRVIGEDLPSLDALSDAEDFDRVIVSGGDGTETSVLYQLRDRAVRTCIFPSGTANLLFANLGNAPEPSAIARACRAGRTALCDLGEISWTDRQGERRTRGFSLMSGTGYDADIMRAALPNKQAMGEAAYFFAALTNPRPTVLSFRIEVDGKSYERNGIACLVANNAMMQGDIEIVPDSRMDDGLLDVIVLETSDAAQLLRPLAAGILDPSGHSVGRPFIENFQGRHVKVATSTPVPMQIDGEVISSQINSYEARVLERANELIVDRMSRYAKDGEETREETGEMAFPDA